MSDRLGLSPIHGGFFSGRYTYEDRDQPSARFTEWGWHEQLDPQAWEVLDEVSQIADARGATVPQVATAWVMAQPGITTAIVGPRTVEQLEDSLGAAEVHLDEDDLRRLDDVTIPLANLWHEPVPRPATGRGTG